MISIKCTLYLIALLLSSTMVAAIHGQVIGDGRNSENKMPIVVLNESIVDNFYTWSPDSSKILFIRPSTPRCIYCYHVNDGSLRKLAETETSFSHPICSLHRSMRFSHPKHGDQMLSCSHQGILKGKDQD